MGCSLIGANKEDLQYVGQLCRCIQLQLQRPILEVDVFTGYSTYALFLHHQPWSGATGGVVMSWSASPHRVPPAISMMSFGARSIRSAERVRPKVIKLIPSERHRSLVRVGLLVYDVVVVMGANVKSVCVRACVRACCVGQRVDRGYRGFM